MTEHVLPARIAGLPPGVAPGPLGRRLVAYLIDSVVPTAIWLLAAVVFFQTSLSEVVVGVVAAVLVLSWALLVWWMFAVRAAGPGMRVMRLQLVGLTNGRPIGWGRFLLRQLILSALLVTGIGLVLMVIFLARHLRSQGWHDLAVDSVVIKERSIAAARPAAQARHAAPSQAVQPQVAQPRVAQQMSGPLSPPAGYPQQQSAPPAQQQSAPPAQQQSAPPAQQQSAPPAQQQQNSGPGSGPRPTRAPDGPWRAVLDDGRELEIDGLVLLGRNPAPRPGEEHATLIKVADTTRTVSKSHLELGLNSAGLYVIDRGSTNGSTVTGVSGVSSRCAPGDPVQVEAGSIVSFGDHWLEIRSGGTGPRGADRDH